MLVSLPIRNPHIVVTPLMLARELTGKPCYYRMTTSSLTLLGRNSLLPIENEEVLELGKELQVVVQATSDSDTKTKGVLTINLHS